MSRPFLRTLAGLAIAGLLPLLSACQKAADAAPGKVALTTTSEEARTLYLQGQGVADQIHFYDANQIFLQAIAKDPNFAMAHWGASVTAPTAKESLDHLKAAVALADKASEGERLIILSSQANAERDVAKAVQLGEELVAKYPEDERAHSILANWYAAQQAYPKEVAELQKAIELKPDFSGAYNALGYAQRSAGDNAAAEAAFKKYIELMPNDPNPYDSYAELLLKMGRFDESIEQYRKALAADPSFVSSRGAIAWALALQGKYDEAIAEAQALESKARDDGERRAASFSRMTTYLDQGKTDLALKELDKQYALGAAIGDTAAMASDAADMGVVLLDAGRAADASKRFQQSVNLVKASSLSQAMKDDAELGTRYWNVRLSLATKDLKTAKDQSAMYMHGASSKQNAARVRSAHELTGTIAIAEKRWDQALAELALADKQEPRVLYEIGLAYQGKGDKVKATEAFKAAADMNILPTISYALVRKDAKKAAGG